MLCLYNSKAKIEMKKLPLTSLWKKLEFEDYYQTCLISLPKKKKQR
jgi:hypothetical protein